MGQALKSRRMWRTADIPFDDEILAANDTSEFINLAAESSVWNHSVFLLLMRHFPEIHYSVIHEKLPEKPNNRLAQSGLLRRIFKYLYGHALISLKVNDKFFFISQGFSKLTTLKLEIGFGQLPFFIPTYENRVSPDYDFNFRQWSLPTGSPEDKFGLIARQLLPKFLPRIFLEGFRELMAEAGNLIWPKSPKVIFTSNAHFSYDLFKAWAAKNVARGTKLVIGEHGGFGPGLFNGCHSYELSVADLYISTGWGDSQYSNIRPLGNFRVKPKKTELRRTGRALLVCGNMPRFSFDIRAMMLSSQVLDYFEDQFCFIDALPRNIQNKILVRLSPQDYGWEQKDRWLDRHPNVEFDNGRQSMLDTATQCRLFIGTYMATTYIESLSSNFPTVMFWNPARWEIKPEAQPFFDQLKSAGIFHESAAAAAHHIANVWDDIPSWWQSGEVQTARQSFCDHYAATPADIDTRLKQILREEANRSTIRASR